MTPETAVMPRPPEMFFTTRLAAHPPRSSDAAEAFHAYAADPAVTRFLSWETYAQVAPLAEFFAGIEQTWAGEGKGAHYAWLLRDRSTNELLGSIGLMPDGRKVSCGYAFARARWGRGYATEALRWVADWAFAQPQIQRVWAFCDVENPASARVMEKAGLEREGVLRRWHRCPNIGPDLRDCIVCAKVK
jgi:[ribosomal protein S5]-alanine N-acetyltransferase